MGFVYLQAKACYFVKIGPETYRRNDALGRPDADMDEEEVAVLMHGMKQLADSAGEEPDRPLTGIPASTTWPTHFTSNTTAGRSSGGTGAVVLDRMIRRHIVTGEVIHLYNPLPKSGFPPAHSVVPGPTLDD